MRPGITRYAQQHLGRFDGKDRQCGGEGIGIARPIGDHRGGQIAIGTSAALRIEEVVVPAIAARVTGTSMIESIDGTLLFSMPGPAK